MKGFILTLLMLGLASGASAAVQGKELTYRAGEVPLQGYVAWDTETEGKKRPGVLVVHEWWGHNDYARKKAREVAELGYVAFALDMYGEGKVADHPDEAGQFASALRQNREKAKERFLAALAELKAHPDVDSTQIAAIGYCFGGGVVLDMVRAGVDLDVAASFHGSLATENPAQKEAVKARRRRHSQS